MNNWPSPNLLRTPPTPVVSDFFDLPLPQTPVSPMTDEQFERMLRMGNDFGVGVGGGGGGGGFPVLPGLILPESPPQTPPNLFRFDQAPPNPDEQQTNNEAMVGILQRMEEENSRAHDDLLEQQIALVRSALELGKQRVERIRQRQPQQPPQSPPQPPQPFRQQSPPQQQQWPQPPPPVQPPPPPAAEPVQPPAQRKRKRAAAAQPPRQERPLKRAMNEVPRAPLSAEEAQIIATAVQKASGGKYTDDIAAAPNEEDQREFSAISGLESYKAMKKHHRTEKDCLYAIAFWEWLGGETDLFGGERHPRPAGWRDLAKQRLHAVARTVSNMQFSRDISAIAYYFAHHLAAGTEPLTAEAALGAGVTMFGECHGFDQLSADRAEINGWVRECANAALGRQYDQNNLPPAVRAARDVPVGQAAVYWLSCFVRGFANRSSALQQTNTAPGGSHLSIYTIYHVKDTAQKRKQVANKQRARALALRVVERYIDNDALLQYIRAQSDTLDSGYDSAEVGNIMESARTIYYQLHPDRSHQMRASITVPVRRGLFGWRRR